MVTLEEARYFSKLGGGRLESPMTVKELSQYLRLDRMTIYKMLKDGGIPASRIGRQWRFFRSDIDEWIRSLRIGQQPSVLVVDTDPLTRQMFEEELAANSFDVVLAVTGDEALNLASQRQFGLVFLELRKATLGTFRRLRQMDRTLPIVLVVGYSDATLVDQAMEIGTFTLIKKPASGADIRSVLSTLPFRRSPDAKDSASS